MVGGSAALFVFIDDAVANPADAIDLAFDHIAVLQKDGRVARKADTLGSACQDDRSRL